MGWWFCDTPTAAPERVDAPDRPAWLTLRVIWRALWPRRRRRTDG